jgi:hypothetical protein
MARQRKIEADIEEYRNLMATPEHFESGFTGRTVIGVFFIACVMMPSSIYLGLTVGQSMGPAAVWVTIILFADVARRSFKPLRRQELYLLYYAAGQIIAMIGGLALAGGPFATLIWRQYVRSSAAAESFGIAQHIPVWHVPSQASDALVHRTFLHQDWVLPIGVMVLGWVAGRVSRYTAGYTLFRMASDVEKLPFPLAPIAAQGATALAESGQETWRWRTFSIGAMIGILFGAVYVFIPALTGAVFGTPVQLIPIPWIDFTLDTQEILPTATTGIATNLGLVITGMVLPFWTVVGRFIAALVHMFGNTLLYRLGVLVSWRRGTETIMTEFMNKIDFWLSFTIGTSVAVALIGFYTVIRSVAAKRRDRDDRDRGAWSDVPAGRGDFSLAVAIGLFFLCTATNISLCILLIGREWYLLIFFFGFGFLYTPLISYVNARLIGLAGMHVGFPMIRQATFVLSGYRGVDIWFAPFPLQDFGYAAQYFRQIELTGTNFRSVIKLELLIFPVLWISSFVFWAYIWGSGPKIPSQAYPYAQKMWHRRALQQCLWISSTLPEAREAGGKGQLLYKAIKWHHIGWGLGFGLVAYMILRAAGLPTMALYGFITGLAQLPHFMIPEMFGALLGRYYFAKKFGRKQWLRATPVLMAGYMCGMGLIGMVGAAIALLSAAVKATGP